MMGVLGTPLLYGIQVVEKLLDVKNAMLFFYINGLNFMIALAIKIHFMKTIFLVDDVNEAINLNTTYNGFELETKYTRIKDMELW